MRLTTRRLMIAVAVVALLLLPVVWLITAWQTLEQGRHDFYGPGGALERKNPRAAQALTSSDVGWVTNQPAMW